MGLGPGNRSGSDPDIHIDAGVQRLTCPDTRDHADANIRVLQPERGEPVEEPRPRESERHPHNELALATLAKEFRKCRIEPAERVAARRDQRFTRTGQAQTPRVALEERHPESLLEKAHLLTYRCGGDTQLLRCCRQAEVSRRNFKRAQPIDRCPGARHLSGVYRKSSASSFKRIDCGARWARIRFAAQSGL